MPPFHLPDQYSTADLISAIENLLHSNSKNAAEPGQGMSFTAHIQNFDAFGDRTIFAKVLQDQKWTLLRDNLLSAVLQAAPGSTKKDQRPF